jgi:tRNA threonylcarbamoyladenosine biosynthesis protein TsaE
MKILIKDIKHLPEVAEEFLKHYRDNRIFAFYGSMGSGKTTIIKEICKHLDVVDLVSSPTFTLINEYKTSGGDPIYHIDFYRIKKQEEVFDFGIEEYWSGESYCFMEWPELVGDILPKGTVSVRIIVDENEQRIILISK